MLSDARENSEAGLPDCDDTATPAAFCNCLDNFRVCGDPDAGGRQFYDE